MCSRCKGTVGLDDKGICYYYPSPHIPGATSLKQETIIQFLNPYYHYVSECFVSGRESNPWMAVDLQEEKAISTVIILSQNIES